MQDNSLPPEVTVFTDQTIGVSEFDLGLVSGKDGLGWPTQGWCSITGAK